MANDLLRRQRRDPLFPVAEMLVVLGQRNDLAEAMGEGNVTAR